MATLLNNRYKFLKRLGSGGFGETFLAEDTHLPSQRKCVIKQLKPITNQAEVYELVKERFQREAAILEALGAEHEQIPSLYAYFPVKGQFYLIQEWVEGLTLTEQVQQQGLLSESSLREMLLKLLPTLDYVHSKKIVHRDIKPDNIILRASTNSPVLIDFGAVRETMGTSINSVGNSTKSIIIGTPGFMPSEQAAGRPVYASDIYAVGLTAIYLLTGKQPEELDSDPLTGEIVWQEYAPNISPNLTMVLDKAIQGHPRDRFLTASAMLSALKSSETIVTSKQSFDSPVTPTVVSPPPSQSPQPLPVTTVTPNGNNSSRGIIQGSLITGGIIGASILASFALMRSPQPVVQEVSSGTSESTDLVSEISPTSDPESVGETPIPTPQPAPTPPPTPTPQPAPTPLVSEPVISAPSYQVTLTQQEANNIVQRWYNAKSRIFGHSFDTSLLDELTTGTLYYESILKEGGGSIGWLRNNGCYYDYEYSHIDGTRSFSPSSSRPNIVLMVREKLRLNGPSQSGCGQASQTYRAYVTYWFEQENGVWKIESYDVTKY